MYSERVGARDHLRSLLPLWAGYGVVAAWTTWPAVAMIGVEVPGASRTDLWNSLWSLWFFEHSLSEGALPFHTMLLDHPSGGSLLVADPVGAVLAAPFAMLLGLPVAYTLLVLFQLALSGVAAHLLAVEVATGARSTPASLLRSSAGWIAGVAYASAPILLSAVHNGTSEAFAGGWPALAALACLRVARDGGPSRVLAAAAWLLVAALSSWYGAVCAFVFAAALVLVGQPGLVRRTLVARFGALALGLALVAPVAWGVHAAAVQPDNLVGIKNDREVALVRRTSGPADPVGYLMPGDYRSPDFRVLSRYGEEFFHCHYLGWVVLIGAGGALVGRRRGTGFLWLAGLAGLVLSLGPVLARHGQAVIVMGDRAIPLPYLLVEGLPGFGSLSLLYRLAMVPALAFAVLAGVGFAGRFPRARLLVPLAILLEGRFASPLAGLPDTTEAVVAPAIIALAEADDGAVMNFPVVGGRGYLYEQTVHHKPLAGSLNFPNNLASRRVWKAMLDAAEQDPEVFRTTVGATAMKQGIRYVVVHVDPMARPDMHDAAVLALKEAYEPLAVPDEAEQSDGGELSDLRFVGGRTVRAFALW